MEKCWVDGEETRFVPVSDRGLQYGDGVFRTMLVWDGEPVAAAAQLDCLRRDARALDLPLPEPERLKAEWARAAHGLGRGVLKQMLTAGDGPRGYRRPDRLQPRRILLAGGLPAHPPAYWAEGIRVRSLDLSCPQFSPFQGAKHLNRLAQVMARQMLPPDCQEGVIADAQGKLCGGTMSTIFWIQDDELHTPPVTGYGVAGVSREQLLALAQRGGQAVRIASPTVATCREHCQAAFVSNAIVGIWPIRYWDGRCFEPHPRVRELMTALDHPFRGQL